MYPPSVTGVGLGPERSGALGVPGVLGDREGCRVVGVALVGLRSSFVAAGVAAAGGGDLVQAVLEEGKHFLLSKTDMPTLVVAKRQV